mgnify:CR=1 FL=1
MSWTGRRLSTKRKWEHKQSELQRAENFHQISAKSAWNVQPNMTEILQPKMPRTAENFQPHMAENEHAIQPTHDVHIEDVLIMSACLSKVHKLCHRGWNKLCTTTNWVHLYLVAQDQALTMHLVILWIILLLQKHVTRSHLLLKMHVMIHIGWVHT